MVTLVPPPSVDQWWPRPEELPRSTRSPAWLPVVSIVPVWKITRRSAPSIRSRSVTFRLLLLSS